MEGGRGGCGFNGGREGMTIKLYEKKSNSCSKLCWFHKILLLPIYEIKTRTFTKILIDI